MQCQNYSIDSGAKGETHIHNICIPMSLTQVQGITRWVHTTSAQAGKKATTAGSGPCTLSGGKEDFCRWNPEPGLNRSHLTIPLPMYSRC